MSKNNEKGLERPPQPQPDDPRIKRVIQSCFPRTVRDRPVTAPYVPSEKYKQHIIHCVSQSLKKAAEERLRGQQNGVEIVAQPPLPPTPSPPLAEPVLPRDTEMGGSQQPPTHPTPPSSGGSSPNERDAVVPDGINERVSKTAEGTKDVDVVVIGGQGIQKDSGKSLSNTSEKEGGSGSKKLNKGGDQDGVSKDKESSSDNNIMIQIVDEAMPSPESDADSDIIILHERSAKVPEKRTEKGSEIVATTNVSGTISATSKSSQSAIAQKDGGRKRLKSDTEKESPDTNSNKEKRSRISSQTVETSSTAMEVEVTEDQHGVGSNAESSTTGDAVSQSNVGESVANTLIIPSRTSNDVEEPTHEITSAPNATNAQVNEIIQASSLNEVADCSEGLPIPTFDILARAFEETVGRGETEPVIPSNDTPENMEISTSHTQINDVATTGIQEDCTIIGSTVESLSVTTTTEVTASLTSSATTAANTELVDNRTDYPVISIPEGSLSTENGLSVVLSMPNFGEGAAAQAPVTTPVNVDDNQNTNGITTTVPSKPVDEVEQEDSEVPLITIRRDIFEADEEVDEDLANGLGGQISQNELLVAEAVVAEMLQNASFNLAPPPVPSTAQVHAPVASISSHSPRPSTSAAAFSVGESVPSYQSQTVLQALLPPSTSSVAPAPPVQYAAGSSAVANNSGVVVAGPSPPTSTAAHETSSGTLTPSTSQTNVTPSCSTVVVAGPSAGSNAPPNGSQNPTGAATEQNWSAVPDFLRLTIAHLEDVKSKCVAIQNLYHQHINNPGSSDNVKAYEFMASIHNSTFQYHSDVDLHFISRKNCCPPEVYNTIYPAPMVFSDVDLTVDQITDYYEVLIETVAFITVCAHQKIKGVCSINTLRLVRILQHFMCANDVNQREQVFTNVASKLLTRLTNFPSIERIIAHTWSNIRGQGKSPVYTNGALMDNALGASYFKGRLEKFREAYQRQQQILHPNEMPAVGYVRQPETASTASVQSPQTLQQRLQLIGTLVQSIEQGTSIGTEHIFPNWTGAVYTTQTQTGTGQHSTQNQQQQPTQNQQQQPTQNQQQQQFTRRVHSAGQPVVVVSQNQGYVGPQSQASTMMQHQQIQQQQLTQQTQQQRQLPQQHSQGMYSPSSHGSSRQVQQTNQYVVQNSVTQVHQQQGTSRHQSQQIVHAPNVSQHYQSSHQQFAGQTNQTQHPQTSNYTYTYATGNTGALQQTPRQNTSGAQQQQQSQSVYSNTVQGQSRHHYQAARGQDNEVVYIGATTNPNASMRGQTQQGQTAQRVRVAVASPTLQNLLIQGQAAQPQASNSGTIVPGIGVIRRASSGSPNSTSVPRRSPANPVQMSNTGIAAAPQQIQIVPQSTSNAQTYNYYVATNSSRHHLIDGNPRLMNLLQQPINGMQVQQQQNTISAPTATPNIQQYHIGNASYVTATHPHSASHSTTTTQSQDASMIFDEFLAQNQANTVYLPGPNGEPELAHNASNNLRNNNARHNS